MKIRRILAMMLAAVAVVCLSGCGETERTDLNACWGMTFTQAAESYGVSTEDAVVQQSGGAYSESVFAEFEKAEVLGVPCKLKMSLEGYSDAEPVLSAVYFYVDSKRDMEKLYERLTALDGYTEIGESEGFYDISALSREEITWMEKYTGIGAGKKGIAFADIRLKDGATYKTGSYGEETVLVQLNCSSHAEDSVYFIQMTDYVFHVLAQKGAYEQLHPDGIPVWEENN